MKKVFLGLTAFAGALFLLGCNPIESTSPDEYEEDDTTLSATPLVSGTEQYHNFYDDPIDWFVFTTPATNCTVVITTTRLNLQGTDTVLFVYDTTGALVVSNDNFYATKTNTSLDSKVTMSNVAASTTLYILSQSAEWDYGSYNSYGIELDCY